MQCLVYGWLSTVCDVSYMVVLVNHRVCNDTKKFDGAPVLKSAALYSETVKIIC